MNHDIQPLIFLEPKTYKDGKGNAVLEIPRRFWEGKDLPSLKIHLSQQILKNLSGGEEENHDCELHSLSKFLVLVACL